MHCFGKDPEGEREYDDLFCVIASAGSTCHEVSSIIYADAGGSDLSDQKLEKRSMDYLDNRETSVLSELNSVLLSL